MIVQPALSVLAGMTVVMVAAWAFGLRRGNGGWTDVFWTWGSGLSLALAALAAGAWPPSTRQVLVAAMALVWALRLGLYLTPRVATHGEDPRYAAFRRQWGPAYARNMLFVTLPQAPATALLALSVLTAAGVADPALRLRDVLGVAVFVAAVLGEGLADAQMKAFKADPANHGKVYEAGLWGWSRHPNYFFEWALWLAYPVIAFEPARPMSWLSFAAPAVMFVLLTRVSGIPPLEAAQLKSKGAAYRDYQARVSAFFPLPPRKAAAA